MELNVQLDFLENAGLIRQAQAQFDPSYLFKHALLQDAVYTSLLKQDRRELHRKTGEVLEQMAGIRLDENAAMLAYHFHEAGDRARALRYYRLAGDRAMRQYAIPEALMQYTQAILLVDHEDASLPVLYRMRGLAYESLGEFELARADHEMALHKAQALGDAQGEWQSLLDLGMLWAGRDYQQTGEYYQLAYEKVRTKGSDAHLGHTLNHLGNWHVNLNRPSEGAAYHLQALAIFERLQDEPSIAATLDFLGTASGLSADLPASKSYYQRAIPLFRRLGDLNSLSSSLASFTSLCAIYVLETCAPAVTVHEVIDMGYESLQIARQIHRRDAEAYALINLAKCHGGQGDYAKAWDAATDALSIAKEIGHRQWLCFALLLISKLLTDLTLYERASQHLEKAQVLVEELGSVYFKLTVTSAMASLFVTRGNLVLAQSTLDRIPPEYLQIETTAQRQVLESCIEVALAQGRPRQVLDIIDQLDQTKNTNVTEHISWRVAYLRGRALTQLEQYESAEASLQAAYREALGQGLRPAQQRILLALAQMREQQGRRVEADQFRTEAHRLAQEIAFQPPV